MSEGRRAVWLGPQSSWCSPRQMAPKALKPNFCGCHCLLVCNVQSAPNPGGGGGGQGGVWCTALLIHHCPRDAPARGFASLTGGGGGGAQCRPVVAETGEQARPRGPRQNALRCTAGHWNLKLVLAHRVTAGYRPTGDQPTVTGTQSRHQPPSKTVPCPTSQPCGGGSSPPRGRCCTARAQPPVVSQCSPDHPPKTTHYQRKDMSTGQQQRIQKALWHFQCATWVVLFII